MRRKVSASAAPKAAGDGDEKMKLFDRICLLLVAVWAAFALVHLPLSTPRERAQSLCNELECWTNLDLDRDGDVGEEGGYFRIKRSSALQGHEHNLGIERDVSWAMPAHPQRRAGAR